MFVASYLGSCAASAASYCACWTCGTLTRETMRRRRATAPHEGPVQHSASRPCAACVCTQRSEATQVAAPHHGPPTRFPPPPPLGTTPSRASTLPNPAPKPRHSARLAYSFLFLLGMLVAWVMRDFARPLLEKIPCAAGQGDGGGLRAGGRRQAWGTGWLPAPARRCMRIAGAAPLRGAPGRPRHMRA